MQYGKHPILSQMRFPRDVLFNSNNTVDVFSPTNLMTVAADCSFYYTET